MAERDHLDHETGTENGEAMHTDTAHTDTTGTDTTGTAPVPGNEPLRSAVPPAGVLTGDGITPGVVTTDVITTDDPAPPPARRRGPDLLTLLVGLATLAMAVFAFVGYLPDLSGFDPLWLLAGGAAVVGLVLLVGSLRSRSEGRRGDG